MVKIITIHALPFVIIILHSNAIKKSLTLYIPLLSAILSIIYVNIQQKMKKVP